MKQKLLALIVVFFLSLGFSYAADDNRNSNTKDNNAIENAQQINEDGKTESAIPITIKKSKKIYKGNAVKRFFTKTKERINDKIQKFKKLAPQRILVLMIIGFLLLLPGMILSMIGVALIPAIILAVVGGTLFIVGVLAGK